MAEHSAGAVSHLSIDWHSINWKVVNETVRRLQARIVKATKVGKWHKVQALQYLLNHPTLHATLVASMSEHPAIKAMPEPMRA